MRFYVPAQTASGEEADTDDDGTLGVSYDDYDGDEVYLREEAKPLISAFVYGHVDEIDHTGDTEANGEGFSGIGTREAYGAVSLDDGFTWKQVNLSESADVEVNNTDLTQLWYGDVNNAVHAVAGNKVVVAWQSRLCSGGSPAYTLTTDNENDTSVGPTYDDLVAYLEIGEANSLYLDDVFGVAGSQGVVDYAEQGYESIGTVPYNCLWTARGVLLTDDDATGDVNEGDDPRTDAEESSHMVWYKAERLTSGRRDVNRPEIKAVAGAGFAITWQEDPEGLRPGKGLGPGVGWSGATAASQTDIWYSFLPWEYFEQVVDEADTTTPYEALTDYWDVVDTTKPKAYVPFAVPMRLTNNARCLADSLDAIDDPLDATDDLYCTSLAVDYGLTDQCVDTVDIPLGQSGQPQPICVSADGLPNVANTAATRARLALTPRDTDGDEVIDSAWAVVILEEDKGLGRFYVQVDEEGKLVLDNDGNVTFCTSEDPDLDPGCAVLDTGKNIWYHSFDMGDVDTSLDASETGLAANLASQGNLINQPETDWASGLKLQPVNTADLWDFGDDYNFDIYLTEIARRGSLLVQPTSNLASSQLTALLMFKQGLLNQGGPADILARRMVRTSDALDANPYDFSNVVCDVVEADDGNPYYPKGVCLSPPINLSSVTPQDCEVLAEEGGENEASDGVCPELDDAGALSQDPTDNQVFDKMLTWYQCPGSPLCTDIGDPLGTNLDDQSWHNPLDLAKGHRGYLWGNMVVAMYAWSPNWKLNAKGSDRYELYIRRSFDGGVTWTTTPADWGGKGTTTCEYMRDGVEGSSDASQVCTTYEAGADEQQRNVSQLSGSNVDENGVPLPANAYTVLDPRYAPDPGTMPTIGEDADGTYLEDFDEFNPSRFFVVFEIGDNTTVAEGEAEPLDMSYSRAVNFGDYYQSVELATQDATTVVSNYGEQELIDGCAANSLGLPGGFCNYFDRLNTGTSTGSEASLAMGPSGNVLYNVWSQADEDPEVADNHAQFARVFYADPYIAWAVGDGDLPDGDTFSPPDDDTIGDGGGDDNGGGGDDGDDDDGDDDRGRNRFGCSVGNGNPVIDDPLLPGMLLAALGYLALRRRMAKANR
jgi:hypothetical protein